MIYGAWRFLGVRACGVWAYRDSASAGAKGSGSPLFGDSDVGVQALRAV